MNTLLVVTLSVALPAYALLWHNQPVRTQKEKATAIEAAFTLLYNPTWLTQIVALITHWVALNIPTKWQTTKIHARRRTEI